jgi:hypothetical protein
MATGVAKAAPGVIEAVGDASEVVLLPLGVTVKVYAVPLASPLTKQDCEPVGGEATVPLTMQPALAGVEVTVYRVAVPSAVNATLIAPLPARVNVRALRAPEVTAPEVCAVDTVGVPPVGVTVKV